MRFAATIAAYLSLAMPAIAGDLSLQLPVQCTLGKTCFVQQYVDRDPTNEARDFSCGTLSYDGHKGTDFGLPSLAAMRDGVNVLAAAPGTVRGMRDGMADRGYSAQTASQIEGRECGNGVVIDHGDGWQTQYCHMKRGSIRVRSGDRVAAGTILGQIGLSGKTQFPHMHLSVRKNGKVVDPFAPTASASCDASAGDALWATPIPYAPTGILNAGFSPNIPSFDAVKDGSAKVDVGDDDGALVLWAYAYGARAGDTLNMEINGPRGQILQQSIALKKTQAQYFRATGKRRPAQGFAKGIYIGKVTLHRDGEIKDKRLVQMTLR